MNSHSPSNNRMTPPQVVQVPNVVQSNRLEIANLVLSALNLAPINDIQELEFGIFVNDKQANMLKIQLDHSIKACLEEFFWNFAMKSENLVQFPDGTYQYPEDCAKLVGLGEENDCCMQALSPFIFTNNENKTVNLLQDLNFNYLQNKNSAKYIQQVSFSIDNGRLKFSVNKVHPLCCDYNYKKLYYIHKNIDNMNIPDRFKDLVVLKIKANIVGSLKPDATGTLSTEANKTYIYKLRSMISQEYEEFKVRIPFVARENRTDIRKGRWVLSPFGNW